MIVKMGLFGVLLPMCFAGVGINICFIMVENSHRADDRADREDAVLAAELVVQKLALAVSDSLNTALMIAGYVSALDLVPPDHMGTKDDRMQMLDYTPFACFAKQMAGLFPSVASLYSIPSGVVTQAYPPLTPGVDPYGHDLINDDARRSDILTAISSQSLVVSGPFPLIQGGVALLSRFPVFRRPKNISAEVFKSLPINETMPYWWGMTASLVPFDTLLHDQVQIQVLLPVGEFDYCLEYWNANSNATVVVSARTLRFDVGAASKGLTLQTELVRHSFARVAVALPQGRQWNLWVRTTRHSDDRVSQLVVGVFAAVATALIIACAYWLPFAARLHLFNALTQIFKKISDMELEDPEVIGEQIPGDSPPQFVLALKQMMRALIMYRKYLPASVKMPEETGDESSVTQSSVASNRSGLSRSMSFSNHSRLSGLSGKPQCMAVGFVAKRVSVVHIEAPAHLSHHSTTTLQAQHTAFLSTVYDASIAAYGSIHIISGSDVVLDFNGARQLISHATAAVTCALRVADASPRYFCGVSTGVVLCGNVGIEEVMSYAICGTPVEKARLLSRYATSCEASHVVCGANTEAYGKTRFAAFPIEIAHFPCWEKTERLYACLVVAESTHEWMYGAKEGEASQEEVLHAYRMRFKEYQTGVAYDKADGEPENVDSLCQRLPAVFANYGESGNRYTKVLGINIDRTDRRISIQF